jgi:NADH:ubiquinone oxidoreductase subunit 6 (subunit J)
MLDINILIDKNKNQNFGYLPIIFLISSIFFLETFLMFSKIFTTDYHFLQQFFIKNDIFYKNFINEIDNITNIETIGHVLYTYYSFFFLAAGIILLIALIGAVTLTKKEKKKENFLTKNLYKQLSRNSSKAIFTIKSKN